MQKLILKRKNLDRQLYEYNLVDSGKIIGLIQIRKKPSHSKNVPESFASHIYYDIEPEYRRKRYGKKILELGLLEAKKLGLRKLVIVCEKDNIASKNIIEANGGIFKNSYIAPLDKKQLLKYKINLD